MLQPLLSVLAGKAKAAGLVAGTALITSVVVGGGAVVVTTVSAESPLPATGPAAPVEEAPPEVEPEPAQEPAATLAEEQEAAAPPHVCLPGEWRNHGHYVSSYARSLPKGPGRGPLVSAAAQSDCGKKAEQVAAGDSDGEAAAGKPAKADKRPKGPGPGKPARPAKAGVGNGKGNGAERGNGFPETDADD